MAASLKLLPGSTVRWRGRRYLIVDYESLDAIIARQPGKRRLERIPVNEAAPDHASHIVSAWTPDLASVPEEAWQKAVKRLKILKPLLNMGNSERTFAHIKKAARALGKHPATVYRWIENYGRSERLSVFLRKERSDRGAKRLSNKVEKIIDAAIKKIYLTAERPDVAAVVEEVNLQCFNSKIKGKPAPNTIRARVSVLSDRLKLEKREGRKRAAEKYEPLKGHFPGADCPLAVAQVPLFRSQSLAVRFPALHFFGPVVCRVSVRYSVQVRAVHRARFPSAGLFAERCNLLTRRSKRRVQALVCQAFRAFRPARLVRRQIRNHGPALLPDGTDPDVGQQTNTDLRRSLLDLRGTRSCAERVLLAFGELRQTNIDLGLGGNARIVANAADPFDTPEQIVIRERINCVNSLAHWQIITESESIKEPRGRSRSQSYSQIALLHSHLFLHDQLTFADISGTDTSRSSTPSDPSPDRKPSSPISRATPTASRSRTAASSLPTTRASPSAGRNIVFAAKRGAGPG